MSFCGFVSFATSRTAEPPVRAMRTWVGGAASSRDDHEWAFGTSDGWVCAYSLVPNAAHVPSLIRDPAVTTVGDFPDEWATGPEARSRRTRLARAPLEGVGGDVPATEFALATWCQDSSALTLYRCPFGSRALFYVANDEWIAFSSLPEPLLSIPGVTAHIDEDALSVLLIGEDYWLRQPDATIFSRLRRLTPGSGLRFSAGARARAFYWQLDPEPASHDAGDIASTVKGLLTTAVRRRVAGKDNVGVQISGGLDSSAVAALAYRECDAATRLFGYTLLLQDRDQRPIDPREQQLARSLVAELPDLTWRPLPRNMTDREFSTFAYDSLARPLPELRFRASPDSEQMRAIGSDRCAVLLTGWGGDEMVSARLPVNAMSMAAERRWGLAGLHLVRDTVRHPRHIRSDVVAPLKNAVVGDLRWDDDIDRRLRAMFANKPAARCLQAVRRRRTDISVRRRRLQRLRAPGLGEVLELHDWLGQRAGIAMAHPLLDRDLVGYCHAMPLEWIAGRGMKRRAFRAALSAILPPACLEREKGRRAAAPPDPARMRAHRARVGRELQRLVSSDTWLHDYVNLEALIAARGEQNLIPNRIDRIVGIVLALASLPREGA